MTIAKAGARIALKNIIFLTDFSQPSEAALPFAVAIATAFGATIHALHVQTPVLLTGMTPEGVLEAMEAIEENAHSAMEHVKAQLIGTPHEVSVVREASVWPALKQSIAACDADLIVLGTHGRTGAQKMLLGSVAEEIFRRAPIPVLTIGPHVRSSSHQGAHFRHVLFATDLTIESLAGAPYAVSLAEENQAQLTLLHVLAKSEPQELGQQSATTMSNAMRALYELVPKEARMWCHAEAVVEEGEPSEQILKTATGRAIDLIVLGLRNTAGPLGAATHLGGAIAHKIVAHAPCPVLTVPWLIRP